MPSVPPPLPINRGRPVPAVIPPLPGQRVGEFADNAVRQSGRDALFLPRGDVFGVWIAVNSTNLNRIRCDVDTDRNRNRLGTGTIYIEFLDLSLYAYPHRPLSDFLDLHSSSSKGRYAYYQIRGAGPSHPGKSLWPFQKLRGPQRTAVEVAQLQASRQPRTAEQARRFYNVGGRHKAGGGVPSRPRQVRIG